MSSSNVPLKLLALDDGGIRGLSELLILREMMARIELYYNSGNFAPSRPRDYFDMIGGTGTGGWIAIMLGRLGMTIDEVIVTYTETSKKVFSEKKGTFSKEGMYKATLLEDVLKEMVKSKLGSDDFRMLEADTDRLPCKTFVSANLAENFASNAPELFRSYKSPRGRSINCYIWEAARATAANPQLFKRARISDGSFSYEFVSSGTGGNNPTRILLSEAAAVFPGRTVGCIISLGAGHPATIAMPDSAGSSFASKLSGTLKAMQIVTATLRSIADDCESEAERTAQRFKEKPDIYFRFSVEQGMQGIGQADVEQSNAVAAQTLQYLKMEEVTRRLDDAVRAVGKSEATVRIGELVIDTTGMSGTMLIPGQRDGPQGARSPDARPQVPALIITPALSSSPPSPPPLLSHCPLVLTETTHILAACYDAVDGGRLDLGDDLALAEVQKCIERNRKLLIRASAGLDDAAVIVAHKTKCVRAWRELQDALLRMRTRTAITIARRELDANGEAHGGHGNTHTSETPSESTGNTSLSEYMHRNEHVSDLHIAEQSPDAPGTSPSEWNGRNGGPVVAGSGVPFRNPIGFNTYLYPSSMPSSSGVDPYITQNEPIDPADDSSVPNTPTATSERMSTAADSDFSFDENVARFLSPNVASLREVEKYYVEQQLAELSFNGEGVLQTCTKYIRVYPIYPMLIAVAFSHASLCLGDHSVLAQLKYDLEEFAKGTTTALSWLIKHADIKARLVEVVSIEPRKPDHEHSCLLNKVSDWRTITKADIVCLGVHVAVLLQDHSRAQELLQQRDQMAQTLLDLLQALLNYSKIDPNMQRIFLYALIKLATKSGRFPQCLKLRNLMWESEPFSGGSFGDVYRGSVISRQDVPLAIKVVRSYQKSKKDRLLKSFASEVVVWSHLRHPNVLPFYGVFQQGGATLCLVSPYMENGNVRSYLRGGPKDANRTLLTLDAARGLEYLHNYNPTIVHTDIKGVNIIVSNSGRACLADFGFATAKDTHQAQAQSTMPSALTIAWSAPETLEGFGQPGHQAHTVRSDIYAFGCFCYEIFCDRDPFQGAAPVVVLGLVTSGKRPERPERGTALHLNDEVWRFMTQCWLKIPAERPSANDAVRLFERLAAKTDVRDGRGAESANEWDYSILEEILAETEHPFSMLLEASAHVS